MFRERREEFGDWKYLKLLGSGGNGEVHLWQNRVSRQRIAVKSLKFPPDRDNLKDKQRWHDEIAFAKEIRHENIVHALTVQPESFANYLIKQYPPEPLVMEYCEKGDLRKKLNKVENMNGMPESEVRNILQCLRNAVLYLHSKGISHRDIKPENLVIKEINGRDVYKLADMGYAREIICTIEASHVGTFEYFAPEVITEPSYSNTVDYWSMGVITFEIICGTRPFLPGSMVTEVIKRIHEKGPDHIAITKSPETNNITYHCGLFHENHVSSSFKQHIERWLRIALAVNPRARAVLVDNNVPAIETSVNGKPVIQSPLKLKIFNDLDRLLTMKILTVFCLHNFRLYSYAISETTSRDGLFTTLSLDTGISVEDLVIILPPDNCHINRFDASNRPIELYIEDFYEKPMVYCTTDKHSLKETSQNGGLSPVLIRALEENTVKSRKHAIDVVKHLMFYVQMQGRYSMMFLQGLLNYAVMVDDWILRYQAKVDEMTTLFWQMQGTMQCYLSQTEHARKMMSEKNVSATFENDSEKFMERFKQIRELFFRTRNRFVSVLRRSKSTINDINGNFNSFLKTVEESASMTIPNELYEKFRNGNNETAPHTANEMFKYFNTFQENNWFVHSPQIENIQATISEIHMEFELIIAVVEKLIGQQVDVSQSINQMACEFNKSIWEIATKSATVAASNNNAVANVANDDGLNIPDLDGIFGALKIESSNGPIVSSNYFNCNDQLSWMSISNEGQSIVGENEVLCDRIQKLLKMRALD